LRVVRGRALGSFRAAASSPGAAATALRLLDALAVPAIPVCRNGHGPLDGWRWRQRAGRRGRYCRQCNAAAFQRWYDAHKRRPR